MVPVPDTDTGTGYDILEKLIYMYEHKLRYEYVPGTDTNTYPVPVFSLKWSTHAS
jgi:hypothetical protein